MMDFNLELPSLLLSLTFLFFLLIIKRRSHNSLNQPPGPWRLPIIGSLHHLLTSLPHQALLRLSRRHGPLMLVRLGQVDMFVVSSPEIASDITKSQDLSFCTRGDFPVARKMSYDFTDIVFAPYGNYWRQLKKICTVELLSAKRVRSFHSIFEQEITKLITDIHYTSSSSSGKKDVNISSMIGALMNSIIARCAFGRTKSEHRPEDLISLQKELMKLVSGFGLVDLFPNIKYLDVLSGTRWKVNRIHKHLDDILSGVIEEHKCQMRVEEVEDVLDVLLRIRDQGELEIPITDDNLKAVILDMFAAGTETSSTVLVWAMSELMKNPEMMDKATKEVRRVLKGKTKITESDLGELHYLKMVIKETLRLHPAGPLLLRQSLETCQVAGYSIPVGTRVMINAYALGRDPQFWDDAESFKPERFIGSQVDFRGANHEFVPFGTGRRICPGITFGVATMEFTLAQLLFNFTWELPNGMKPEELDMTESSGLTVDRKRDLCLLATPVL